VSVWADGLWMLAPEGGLGDEIATLLEAESNGLSCDALAMRLGRRRSAVIDELRSDSRFERSGNTRGSRWRLASRSASWDGMGRNKNGAPYLDAIRNFEALRA
jgi:hypothetical protein